MKKSSYIPHRRNLLFAAISLSLLPISGTSLAQDDIVEEVIVTGSYIRRSAGFTQASAMTQFSAEDIENTGTVNMGEIIQNLTFVNGAASAVTDTIQGTSGNFTSIDLRGLGASATLTLMDGMRVPTNNVNRLLPTIALERLDIVVDGAAALYGSEAVAGVANFIPIKRYDGFKIDLFSEGDDRGDFDSSQVSFLFGSELAEGVNFVLAGSFRDSGELKWIDRPDLMNAGLTFSSTANPGNFSVPLRDENGVLTGASQRQPDPNCGAERQDPSVHGANPNGFMLLGRCRFDFGDQRDFREPNQVFNLYSNFSYEVNDDLMLSVQVNFARQLENGFSSTSNPGGRDSELPLIRGELPGNPFRAVDANGNMLFARDANGDTLPDRNANGVVILDPNGIAFNEDVSFNGWRPIGKSNTLSGNQKSNFQTRDEGDDRDLRLAFTADFTVPYVEGWEGKAFYTWMRSEDLDRSSQSLSFSAIEQGLNCDTLTDRDACFNPFAVVDPQFATSVAVMDQIKTAFRERNVTELQTFDLILNGDVPLGGFELPGGAIGAAIGYQRREDSFENTPPANIIAGDMFIGDQVDPFSDSREVNSWFLELAFPILDNLEFSAAVRNEDFSTGQESTDPKFGIVYSPTNWLTLRSTSGESFIAPTLTQLNAPTRCGLTNVDDPFSTFSGFVASCGQGNQNLVPESADNLSFGIDLALFDSLDISVTWNKTDFSDRIVATSTEDILRSDFFNFQQSTGFAGPGDPSDAQLAAWVASGQADVRIIRNPNDLTKIDRILRSDSNASSINVEAVDLRISYTTDIMNLGTFRFGLSGTYIDTYEFQLADDRPKIEGAGEQNGNVGGIPALPRWKGNATLNWTRGQHAATVVVHYIHDLTFDANDFSFSQLAPFSTFRSVDTINAWTDVDALYSYRDVSIYGGTASFTVGLRNLFDRDAQKTGMFAGVIGELQDPLGRIIYARASYEF